MSHSDFGNDAGRPALGDEELDQLCREGRVEMPDRERVTELRARLLAAAAAPAAAGRVPVPARHRTYLALAAAVAALLLGAGLRARHPHRSGPSLAAERRGTVQPLGSARFSQEGTPADERVRLADGTIRIEVKRLKSGERFRVLVGASEVEVRGTQFDVSARAGRLLAVHVFHGRVEVRPHGAKATLLSGGEQWRVEETVPVAAQGPTSPVRPERSAAESKAGRDGSQKDFPVRDEVRQAPARARPPRRETPRAPEAAPPPAPASPSPAERAFAEGFAALRRNEYPGAAAAFQRAALVAGDQPLGEDAWFWHGVARARAGQRADAMLSLRHFLDRYPRSLRAGEAQGILGWLYYDEKADAEAERCFRAAVRDPAPAIRDNAQAGLSALLARHKARPAK